MPDDAYERWRRNLGGGFTKIGLMPVPNNDPDQKEESTMSRFTIIDAYERALGDRDASRVDIEELVPRILDVVPGVTVKEIVDALRWDAKQKLREADTLQRFLTLKFGHMSS